MGCAQSSTTGGAIAISKGTKKHNIGSNLVVTKQRDFRDDYKVEKRIGEGSISNIYKIRAKSGSSDIQKGMLYALKEIDTSLVKPEFIEEMRNEIALMRNITHPNILKIYEVYENKKSGHMSIVMELCSGGDLNKRAPYTEQQAKAMVAKLLEATNYLHKCGIVHRDIKVCLD